MKEEYRSTIKTRSIWIAVTAFATWVYCLLSQISLQQFMKFFLLHSPSGKFLYFIMVKCKSFETVYVLNVGVKVIAVIWIYAEKIPADSADPQPLCWQQCESLLHRNNQFFLLMVLFAQASYWGFKLSLINTEVPLAALTVKHWYNSVFHLVWREFSEHSLCIF